MPVGWAARKLDSLGGAVVAAVGGGGASQWREFLQQYLQRLGGHIDEARRNVDHLAELHAIAEGGQKQVVQGMLDSSQERVDSLTGAMQAITTADPWVQPVTFARHMDPLIARATLDLFQPALPLDTVSLVWAGIGMVLSLIIYEGVKETLWAPIGITRGVARRRERRQRARPAVRERIEPSL